MQLILYSKGSEYQSIPEVIDFNNSDIEVIIKACARKGTICLGALSDSGTIKKVIKKAAYYDCGEKAKKIDLKRALKFDEKKHRNNPKALIFCSSSVGSFKSALAVFYSKHFTIADPPCLIIIPDEIHSKIVAGSTAFPDRNIIDRHSTIDDRLLQLINIPESDPKIKRLADIYLGNSLKIKHTRALIYRAAMTDSPVLILGESGTGKDVIASQIFELSAAYKKEFFRINCSTLPESLLEGELFGYKKGIFTGAVADKEGLFSVAENGTIFLDEIGDLSPANQVKILHAVEKKGIRQIGGTRSKPANVRIIAATNRNLDAMMMQGTFREDLYYRISTFRITSPSLREHPDDIPLLVESYWKRKKRKGRLTRGFLNYLKEYSWPGNVRELNSMLNSLADYFGDISPTPEHVEAIRKSRQETLIRSVATEAKDFSELLRIKNQDTLISLQNILRSLKIELQPYIGEEGKEKFQHSETENLKLFLQRQLRFMNDLCLELRNIRQWEISEATNDYCRILERTIDKWTDFNNAIKASWVPDLKVLDEKINRRITEAIWGKIDM